MADAILSNPNQRLVNNRFDDVECHDQNSDIEIPSSSFKTILKRRKIIIISTFSLILLAVAATILSAVFIVKANQAKTFRKELESLLDKKFAFLDAETRQRYMDEMVTLFKRGYVSSDCALEFETYTSFETYNVKYAVQHANDRERRQRFYIFRTNYHDMIKNRNGKELYDIEINKFSDMTKSELNKLFPKLKVPKVKQQLQPSSSNVEFTSKYQEKLKLAKGLEQVGDMSKLTGENIDWRKANVVSKVRDQGLGCSSAWAFAAVSSVESLFKLYQDKDLELSAQEVLNCDFKSKSCNGGSVTNAFEYLTQGVDLETHVPYTGSVGRCKADLTVPYPGSKNKIGSQIFTTGADVLNKSLVISPTVVYLSIGREFLAYKGGLYDGPCGKSPNHAVLLVGEGLDQKTNKRYWIIKNSWGENWGERGYARLVRTDDKFDKCDILKVGFNPSFVKVESEKEKKERLKNEKKAAKAAKTEKATKSKATVSGKPANKTEKKGF